MNSGYGFDSIILLLIYSLALLAIGYRLRRSDRRQAEEYLLMGRRLSLPGFVATLVSTWYGGILGVGEYSYRHGISNWIVFGLPYYLAALIFAIFLARKAQASRVLTIPDHLEKTYGRRVAILGSIFIFINAIPGAYVLQAGVLAQALFKIPLELAVIVGAIITTYYVFSGGFKGDVITDIIQFILMFAGFGIMIVFLISQLGFWNFLSSNLPIENLTWHGGKPFNYILVWYFIALATLVEPAFYQRCFAARSAATARNGILISIAFWALFDFMTTFSGMYARALLPNLADPMASYPQLGLKILPPILQGIFLLGLFATVMSTADSYIMIAGTTLGKDIIGRIKNYDLGDQKIVRVTRIGIIIAGLMAVGIALFFKSIIDIWYYFGSLTTASLLIPLLSSYFGKRPMYSRNAILAILLSAIVVIFWSLPSIVLKQPHPLAVDPIYPGLAVSLLIYSYDYFLDKAG